MSTNWGATIRRLREDRHLNQVELALKGGVTRSWLTRAESGAYMTIKDDMLEKLARGLDMTLVDLRKEIWGIPNSEPGKTYPLATIPIIGYITAGIPAPAEQQSLGVTYVEEGLLEGISPENVFALIVSGDSLKNDGVHTGDIAIVERTTDIINGRVYAVKMDNQSVARHVHKLNDHLRLTAANGDYKEISATDVEIQGRIILCYKPPIKL
jgi:repressor LexA